MKKIYAAPAVVTSDSAVLATKGPGGSSEPNGTLQAPGSVGFNL